jgi:hypothetical protein
MADALQTKLEAENDALAAGMDERVREAKKRYDPVDEQSGGTAAVLA